MHPDAPITRSCEDALNRTGYARGIAASIRAYGPTDSIVVGLVGPWGSGKSSLINLITESLKDDPDENARPIIVRFNPWRYAGTEYLFASFFATVARALGAYDQVASLKKAAGTMRRASAVLGKLKIVPVAGPFLGGLANLLRSGSDNVQELISDVGTLDTLHEELTKELSSAKKRILVVIDDIDRLSPEEILQTFQLVKVLADFPYVMYLLAYDESIVHRAIHRDLDVARSYLEKIVTLPLDVPPPHRSVIDNMVISETLELLKPVLPRYLNEERLINAYINTYREYFSTLRDVRRFLNLFAFNYGRVSETVDIGDLAALTALQVFEHGIYRVLAADPSAVIDTDEALWRRDADNPGENKRRIETLIDRGVPKDRDLVVALLRKLFHKVDFAFKGQSYNFSLKREKAEARITSPDHFNLFFNMGNSPSDISDEEYAESIRLARQDVDNFLRYMQGLGLDKTINFVDRILEDKSISELEPNVRLPLIIAIWGLAERFERLVPIGILSVPFDWKIGWAVSHLLANATADDWFSEITSAVSQVRYGIGPAVTEISRLVRLQGSSDAGIPPFTERQLVALKELAAAQVQLALSEGRLDDESYLLSVVHCLAEWGFPEIVDSVLTALPARPQMLYSLIFSAQQRGGFEGILTPKPARFSLDNLYRYIERDRIRELLLRLRDSNFGDDKQRRLIQDFLAQADRAPITDGPEQE